MPTGDEANIGGTSPKREAVEQAARRAFARDGYLGASIDVIAEQAGVSTRTIYNHFAGKDDLFTTVITRTAGEVATALIAVVHEYLDDVDDLQTDLIAFSRAWLRTPADFGDHFAMVRHLYAEAERIPPEAIEAWDRTGPRAAMTALAHQLRRLCDDGQIDTEDPERAAIHLLLLTTSEIRDHDRLPGEPLTETDQTEIVTAGVLAFLDGYRGRSSQR